MKEIFTVHHAPEAHPDTSLPDKHQDTFSKTVQGFWIYLMTDCLLFASLFVTYAVLHSPLSKEIFELKTAFLETMLLLLSSVTCGFSLLSAVKYRTQAILGWLSATLLLGASFVAIELQEFAGLIAEGHSFTQSGFLSAFFTLVGTHGAHVTFGLLWIVVLMAQFVREGLTTDTFRRLVIFGLFWHFLDLVWIFIFTFVYLMGVS